MVWYCLFDGLFGCCELTQISMEKRKSPYNQEQIMNLMTFQIVEFYLGDELDMQYFIALKNSLLIHL